MANRDCKGEYFTIEGKRLYRCFWNGEVIVAPEGACPNCRRPIEEVRDHGDLTGCVQVQRVVDIPFGKRVVLPNRFFDVIPPMNSDIRR